MAESKKEVQLKPIQITPYIMNIHKIHNFYPYNFEYGKRVTRYQELDIFDDKYAAIAKLFEDSRCNLHVRKVIKVYNPYLKKALELKRNLKYNYSTQNAELFYGTKDEYVDTICEYNFNWRNSGNKPDQTCLKGVHFTTDPSFAASFCDPGPYKVIILAHVLLRNKYTRNKELVVPPSGRDTVVGNTTSSLCYIKFDDNEFYPAYLIYCISEQQ